ncbi:MAG: ATP-binding protein [Dehalococcoidia bacterium]|nr:ATP-binding protein [Dehalococcoidia bacterium]MDP7239678.1 ATP-binding protein [Dehalococcoidia bacterium]
MSGQPPTEEPEEPCPVCRGAGFIHPTLASGQPDFSRLEPCACLQRDRPQDRLARLELYSNLGPLTRLTFENLNPGGRQGDSPTFAQAHQAAQAFAQGPLGWLVISGPSGTGKTHLAAAIANKRMAQGEPALFVSVAQLLDHLRAAFSPNSQMTYDQLLPQVKTAPLLALDDLGGHFASPWAADKLFQVIDYRYQARLPTVFTTRLPLSRLEEPLRQRLTDTTLSRVLELEGDRVAPLAKLEVLGQPRLKRMIFSSWKRRQDLPAEQQQTLNYAHKKAKEFAAGPEGWLVFMGTNGCGKTHLAAAIAHHRRAQGEPAMFLVIPDLLDHLRHTFSPDSLTSYDEAFEAVRQTPMLILDDFGEHASTAWAHDKLYQLLNFRYNAELPTVITTSLHMNQIESRYMSRIGDPSTNEFIIITAPDYRMNRKGPEIRPPR